MEATLDTNLTITYTQRFLPFKSILHLLNLKLLTPILEQWPPKENTYNKNLDLI